MIVLADTGPLYALIDRNDTWHERIAAWWGAQDRHVVVPISVLPEVSYLLQTRISPDAEQAFIRAVAEGAFLTEPLEAEDITRAAELMRVYADLPLGFVDATIVAIAERLDVHELLTTDRRHFGVVRSAHVDSLVLLP